LYVCVWFTSVGPPSRFAPVCSVPGGLSEEVTPDPIPNSVVKLFCADGTA
jgi:hypothetical protein